MFVDYTKMNGLKNDFIVFEGAIQISSETVASLCDRKTGIGADGVLVVTKINPGQVQMEYWNADGSTAEMCGNGLRCAARFAVDNQIASPGEFVVQTPVGPLKVVCGDNSNDDIEVQVGRVEVEPAPVMLHGFSFYKARVGNPHAITIVKDTDTAPVKSIGPRVEKDSTFPHKTNVEFVEIVDSGQLKLRVWERGVGETLACGTGMVASAVVSSVIKKTQLPIEIEVEGGTAKVWVDDDGFARLLGPVETTETGKVKI